ncbi:MAG: OPT family oligopeptide transporter [Myxococcota bacterium]
MPIDRRVPSPPELTLRAIVTGMILGATLSLCNIYSGLKVGWTFNMSIAAALLSHGFWQSLHRSVKTRAWGMLENNINQTAASSGAAIIGAGLVAPIPAYTMLTGQQLSWGQLSLWTFAVSLVGVVVAVGLRRQLLVVDQLPFPQGVATAETLKEIYGKGVEALVRTRMLITSAMTAALAKVVAEMARLTPVPLPGALSISSTPGRITLGNLGFAVDPSLMMVAFGAIIGPRAATSLMLGALGAWGIVAPAVIHAGWVQAGEPDGVWFAPLVEWLLWPGVAMMVTASLTSFALSWRSIFGALQNMVPGAERPQDENNENSTVPRRYFIGALAVVTIFAVVMQSTLFGIGVGIGISAVLLTFLLAIVAGRVSGETGITPIGAMGKVTQLTFGAISNASPTTNLMTANVTGGAASQCADMLHDLKAGLMIGASPRSQAIAQVFGVLAGALAGSAGYLLLVPDPATMLMTPQWPAPAVATWKAVAELFVVGWQAVPPGSLWAMTLAGIGGILLTIIEAKTPSRVARYIPSPASIGLAFVIPAWTSISVFIGGIIHRLGQRYATHWTQRFLLVLAAGVVAGESLAGVAVTVKQLLFGS